MNLAAFADHIATHFISAERRAKLATICAGEEVEQRLAVKDVIPLGIKDVVRANKEAQGITWDGINQACGVAQREFYPTNASSKRGFSRQTIQRLADYFSSDDLRRYATSDVYWDRIISIEYVGEKQTYDLEIADTHNFIANDILVHNSHAADYAVICVQTAFLKARYPVEYMAALLLIERDKTEKVINFINEARRMGIDVLPPDVNYSGLDFDIQERPADVESKARRDINLAYPFPVPEGSAIRFGMAAVKNVGEAPVNAILAAREEGGPFTSLEEFCDRVDLRQVNKRALECLIRVGAFDRFGKRSQMLEVLDQMVAQSASVHNARDSGQLSMFDLMGSAGGKQSVSPIRLPDLEEVKGREKLQWEKELLGVYAMEHPLSLLNVDIRNLVTCGCSELDERYDGKNVMLAGMIVGIRTINTKKGDQMAFVQLEDMTGQCEVVVFPRTYAEVKEMLLPDAVVVVKGKAQARESQTSLLADSFQTHVDQILSIAPDPNYQKPLFDVAPTVNGLRLDESEIDAMSEDDGLGSADTGPTYSGMPSDDDAPPDDDSYVPEPPAWLADAPVAAPPAPAKPVVKQRIVDTLTADSNPYLHESHSLREQDAEEYIPMPAGVEVDLDALTSADDTTPAAATAPAPEAAPAPVDEPSSASAAPPSATNDAAPVANGQPNGHAVKSKRDGAAKPGKANGNGNGNGHTPRTLQIVFRPSGELDRDKYRLKEIVDRVRDPRGRAQFMIVLKGGHGPTKLAFPDELCSISDRLQQDLTKFFRVEVSVEE